MGGRSRRRRGCGRERSSSSGSEGAGGGRRAQAPPKRSRGDNAQDVAAAPVALASLAAAKGVTPPEPLHQPRERGAWRQEAAVPEEDDEIPDGLIVQDETEEDVARKLAESRKRREALMAKWVTRGEGQEGGGLNMPDTACSFQDDSGSDGETAQFFAQRHKEQQMKYTEPTAVEKAAAEAKRAVTRFIMEQKAREEERGDMFGEEDEKDTALNKCDKALAAQVIGQTGASGADWDEDMYYKAQLGEVMDNRYRVVEIGCGKGTFSNVIKAQDQQSNSPVAIKIIRTNDMMRKAAEKEVDILNRLNQADRGNKKHVIRLLQTFLYRDHYCLVFECMWDNLRVAMKKYTKGEGMSLKAVRAYTKQLLVALRHIHRSELIHADIKPDNILISAGHNLVKICDLGSAMDVLEVEITPYLVSRFYRAPEIVLGCKYSQPLDTFSLGGTIFELFTGKILFPGKSNNDMLRLFMEVKGKPPHKFIKTGTTWKQHFDDNLDFKFVESKKSSAKTIVKTITDLSAKRPILDSIMARIGPEKPKSTDPNDLLYVKKAKQLADLLSQMTNLDPEKRGDLETLQSHPFVADAMERRKEGAADVTMARKPLPDAAARKPSGKSPG